MTRDLDPRAVAADASAAGRRLVVLRHGRTEWNAVGRAQGHANISLDDVGREQAEAVAPYLASLDPTALWTSDLARARETCAFLEKETGLSAIEDARLREFDVGARQGLTMPEFAQRYPHEHAAWVEGSRLRLEGAEIDHEVAARMGAVLHQALHSVAAGETVVAVTHGASLKLGVVSLLGWPTETATAFQGIDNCAWVTLEELSLDGRVRMSGYNESVRPGHDAPQRLPDEG